MHVIQRPVRQRVQKRMYLASERQVVNGVGLGEVDGLFNIGKMFSRLTHFTPRSFQLKNIAGALGSFTAFTATGGLSSLAPKLTGAHSTLMKDLGYGVAAVGAVVGGVVAAPMIGGALGIGGTAATGTGLIGTAAAGSAEIGAVTGVAASSGGIMSTIGSGISAIGSGFMNVMKVLPVVGQVLGGGGGGQQQQQQVDPYAQQYVDQQAYAQAQAQAQYDAQVRAQQAAMYQPAGYGSNMPVVGTYGGSAIPADMNTSYGDLRSPYTGVTEEGQPIQVDPLTGQPIQPGMSTEMMIGLSAVALALGVYFMSGSKSESNN